MSNRHSYNSYVEGRGCTRKVPDVRLRNALTPNQSRGDSHPIAFNANCVIYDRDNVKGHAQSSDASIASRRCTSSIYREASSSIISIDSRHSDTYGGLYYPSVCVYWKQSPT